MLRRAGGTERLLDLRRRGPRTQAAQTVTWGCAPLNQGDSQCARGKPIRLAGKRTVGVGSPQEHAYRLRDMNEGYDFDIFRREFDGSYVWVGARETFARAREAVVQDPTSIDREFLIVNSVTGEKVFVLPPERPPVESPA